MMEGLIKVYKRNDGGIERRKRKSMGGWGMGLGQRMGLMIEVSVL